MPEPIPVGARTARVVVAAGGTGGHVFPALAVANRLRAHGAEVVFAGTASGLEARVVPEQGYPLLTLPMRGLRGKGPGRWLAAPWILGRAVASARRALRRERVQVVLGMGGYASAPVGLAARSLGLPLCLHEQNAVPGLTNRLLASLARRVFLGFPDARLPDGEWVGNPVREAIAALAPPVERFRGRGRARLLIMGGSQGAKVLNTLALEALALLPEGERPEVWHQTGTAHWEEIRAAYGAKGVAARVEPFIGDMAEALGWADIALCRAGAATVAELAAAGLGAVFVPFPFAVDDHQAANAQFLVERGAARMLRQEGLTAEGLLATLQPLLGDPQARLAMAERARAAAKPDAAETVAAACLALAAKTS